MSLKFVMFGPKTTGHPSIGGFQGILPATFETQGLADERGLGKAVEQAQLADGIGDVDLGFGLPEDLRPTVKAYTKSVGA